jgi:integrase
VSGHRVKGPRFHTESEGDTFLDRCRALILAGAWPGEHYGHTEHVAGTTVAQLFDAYQRDRQLGRQTLDDYRGLWKRNIAPTFADKPVATITKDAVLKWRDTTLSQKRRTDKKTWDLFRALMAHAVEGLELLDKNPTRGLSYAVPKKRASEKYALTLGELSAYMAATYQLPRRPYSAGLILRLMAVTGLRIGEARALTVEDLNLNDNPPTVTVWEAIANVRTDDGDGWEFVTKGAKTDAGAARYVSLPPFLVQELRDYIQREGKIAAALLFPAPRTGGYQHHSVVLSAHNAAKKIANLQGRAAEIPPHDLRRTLNVLLQRHAGATVGDAMQMFGWADAAMATTRYSAVGLQRNAETQTNIVNLVIPTGTDK